MAAQASALAPECQAGSDSMRSSELSTQPHGLVWESGGELISNIQWQAINMQRQMQEAARAKSRLAISGLVTSAENIGKQLAAVSCLRAAKGCPMCGLVPVMAHLLEQQHDEVQEVVAVLDSGLHKVLPAVAAALLQQGHSTRAFRRITEAYEM